MKIKNAEKLAALCLAAVMGVSVTACSGGNMYATSNESATIADNDVITIGSVTTNSGAAAAYGEAEVNGFKLAVKEINADGGIFGKQIKLESMDDKGDVIEASNAFNRLAGDKNVIAVLGPTISSTSGAVAPLADQNQMPTIAPAATADSVETGGYLFRTCFKDSFQGEMVAAYAKDQGWTKAAVLYATGDTYSSGLHDSFVKAAEKYGIDIMGFHILLDDEDIVEREKYTPEEFYDKMRAAKGIPSTAAITPIQFCEKYCQYVDEGYTDVIHVPINRSGSSTYNNAVMAQGMLREERPEHHLNIHLLDPHTYSMVFGWYLCEMARKLQNGAELRHVIGEFEAQMNKMEVILGPYSLKQMKKSGRISAAAAVMGELMGIRPIITLIDGKTKVESKVRGDDKVIPAMIDLCKKRTEGVEDFDYMIGHTSIPQAAELEKACRKAFGKAPLSTFNLGGVVSANTGPDTLALVYVGKPRD